MILLFEEFTPGLVAQLVEQRLCKAKVRSSNLLKSTGRGIARQFSRGSSVVERRTENPCVAGSIPALGT